MDHIMQCDWYTANDSKYFLTHADLDKSNIDKILHNKFRDPLISSDSEDEQVRSPIDWDKVFQKRNTSNCNYVPGCRNLFHYPKLSALSQQQHLQCLKVICAEYPHVLPSEFIPRPTKFDHKVMENIKHIYDKEKKEFIKWAKQMWTNTHCSRALRPKPTVEEVYETEFEMKVTEMESWPKKFELVAQIPLLNQKCEFEMVLQSEVIDVDPSELPKIELPQDTKLSVMTDCSRPVPCTKHPCRFVLPFEKSVSILPITEVHKELAQFAMDNEALYVASEKALKCLVELDVPWMIAVSVCPTIMPDGEKRNVVILSNDFTSNRQPSQTRVYRAFRHLLQYVLIPPDEKARILNGWNQANRDSNKVDTTVAPSTNDFAFDAATDDEDDENLVIDIDNQVSDVNKETDFEEDEDTKIQIEIVIEPDWDKDEIMNSIAEVVKAGNECQADQENKTEQLEMPEMNLSLNCTCEGTWYERPPPRSFKKWKVANKTDGEVFDVMVHCSHKVRDDSGEIILEPVPEYQLELGASSQSVDKIRSLMLSMFLRKNASVVNAYIDATSGEIVTCEKLYLERLKDKYSTALQESAAFIHGALGQLQGLLPGNYLLKHEVEHGANALLYVARNPRPNVESMTLDYDVTQMAKTDEATTIKAPTLTDILLPMHKHMKTLPCAFTPFPNRVARDNRKASSKQKTPPQAIRWPKRRGPYWLT